MNPMLCPLLAELTTLGSFFFQFAYFFSVVLFVAGVVAKSSPNGKSNVVLSKVLFFSAGLLGLVVGQLLTQYTSGHGMAALSFYSSGACLMLVASGWLQFRWVRLTWMSILLLFSLFIGLNGKFASVAPELRLQYRLALAGALYVFLFLMFFASIRITNAVAGLKRRFEVGNIGIAIGLAGIVASMVFNEPLTALVTSECKKSERSVPAAAEAPARTAPPVASPSLAPALSPK